MHNFGKIKKRGQVTVFIVIALLIVAGVGIYFLVKNNANSSKIPSEFQNVYGSFSSCIEDVVISGAKTLESQGGYIYLTDFESGSEHMPFSSHLNFLGNPVPYWHYVSGNNIAREKVPSLSDMENELQKFVNENAPDCIPENLEEGYEITSGTPNARISINPKEILLNLEMDISMSKGEQSVSVKNNKIAVDSELGNLHNNAVKVYDSEQNELFLENYSIDVINSYAPVDGVEFLCSPKVWSADEVFDELGIALEENIKTLKTDGSSDDYFAIDSLNGQISNDVYVRFLTSKEWPRTYEVNPSDGPIMIANPVGMQEGLGILGFCYVSYHFVYDVKYPVMVQVHSRNTDEVFQFPFAVVIENNNARKTLSGTASSYEGSEICNNKNSELEVRTYDARMNPVDSQIYFECSGESCLISDAENSNGVFSVPQCVNGFLSARAEGYKDAEVMVSTMNSGSIEIIMDKKYSVGVNLKLDSANYNGDAIIYFTSEDSSEVVSYPADKEVELGSGDYEISVYTYKESSLALGASTQQYCTEVPRAVTGFLGLTKKECYDIQVPESVVTRALSGGGKGSITVTESQLRESNEILINAESLPEPDSLNQIQENYVLYENKKLEVMLR